MRRFFGAFLLFKLSEAVAYKVAIAYEMRIADSSEDGTSLQRKVGDFLWWLS